MISCRVMLLIPESHNIHNSKQLYTNNKDSEISARTVEVKIITHLPFYNIEQ